MLENIDWTGTGTNSVIIGAIIWVWRKISSAEGKMSALELKVAENYATKPDLQRVEDKIDNVISKIDNVNNNLLLLLRTKVEEK